MMGSSGMVVMDEDACLVDVSRFFSGLHPRGVLRQMRLSPASGPARCFDHFERLTKG